MIRDKQTHRVAGHDHAVARAEDLAAAEKIDKARPRRGCRRSDCHVKDLSPDLAKELGLDASGGVVISSVQPGSRADEAGLRARDVILEVNRAAVKDVDSYQNGDEDQRQGQDRAAAGQAR